MTIKRKRKIYRRKLLKKIAKDFTYQIINGISCNDPIGLLPEILQEEVKKGDVNDR